MPSPLYTDENKTTIPVALEGGATKRTKLGIHIRHENGKRETLEVLDGLKIPETEHFIDKIPPISQYIPGRALVESIQTSELSNINVGDLLEEIRKYILDFITIDEDCVKGLSLYILSSWVADCFDVFPAMLLTSYDSRTNANYVREIIRPLLYTIDDTNKAEELVSAACCTMTLILAPMENTKEYDYLVGAHRRGKIITRNRATGDIYGPRIICRTNYTRYIFAYDIDIKQVNADNFYLNVGSTKRIMNLRKGLISFRMKHANQIYTNSKRTIDKIDLLGNYSNIKTVEKYKPLLLPLLLFKNDWTKDLKTFVSRTALIDYEMEKIVLDICKDYLEKNAKPEWSGIWLRRGDVVFDFQNRIKHLSKAFEDSNVCDRVLGRVLTALQFAPINTKRNSFAHWVQRSKLAERLELSKSH